MRKKKSSQTGGVHVQDVSGRLDIHGNLAGRDAIEHQGDNFVFAMDEVDEKNGCLLAIERVVVFIFALLVAGVIFGLIGAIVAAGIGGPDAASIGVVVGLLFAMGFAISAASNVSRHRSPA
jgi:hypothetical protein